MINLQNIKGEYIALPYNLTKNIFFPFIEFNTIGFDSLQFIVDQSEHNNIITSSSITSKRLIIGVFYDLKNKKPVVYNSLCIDYLFFITTFLDPLLYYEYDKKQKIRIEPYYNTVIHDYGIKCELGDEIYMPEIETYEKLKCLYEKYNIEDQINEFIEKNKIKNNLDTFFELLYEYETNPLIWNNNVIKKYHRMYKLQKII